MKGDMEEWNTGRMEWWNNACPVKCDACPVKCDVGAISTGEEWNIVLKALLLGKVKSNG